VISFTQYLLRVLIVNSFGLDAAGIYQASTSLCLIYVGIILNAMLTDFYPRLSAAANKNEECVSLVNQQIEVGLLLAAAAYPGICVAPPRAPRRTVEYACGALGRAGKSSQAAPCIHARLRLLATKPGEKSVLSLFPKRRGRGTAKPWVDGRLNAEP
jgi:hypothetical protein